jgi:hypothetical protein
LGESVIVAGFPLPGVVASSMNLTTGTVSALAGLNEDTRMIQFTAPVQPGNSGGPLLDQSGHVVGIVASKLSPLWTAEHLGDLPENVNFAIKGSVVRDFLDSKGIDYSTAGSTTAFSTPTVAEQIKGALVAVECSPRANLTLGTGTDTATSLPSPYPARWKSLENNTTKALRFDGDHIYVETLVPDKAREQGAFSIVDLKKDGTTYKGTARERRICNMKSVLGSIDIPFLTLAHSSFLSR